MMIPPVKMFARISTRIRELWSGSPLAGKVLPQAPVPDGWTDDWIAVTEGRAVYMVPRIYVECEFSVVASDNPDFENGAGI